MPPIRLRTLALLVCLVAPLAAAATCGTDVGRTAVGHAALPAGVAYANPVLDGDFPDPSVMRANGSYWAATTWSANGLMPLMRSSDLVHWRQTGAVLPKRPPWAKDRFWAPELVRDGNRYLAFYTAGSRNGRLCVAVAEARGPGGPYQDLGPLVCDRYGSIDPTTFVDPELGRVLVWKEDGNNFGRPSVIWAQQLSPDRTRLVGERHALLRNRARWEGGVVEAPELIRRAGSYYLFYSGNACCGTPCRYAMGVARSPSPFGPYRRDPDNPILGSNRRYRCPGHGGLVYDRTGDLFLLYHAYRVHDPTKRVAMLDDVRWGRDGWPQVGDGTGPRASGIGPR